MPSIQCRLVKSSRLLILTHADLHEKGANRWIKRIFAHNETRTLAEKSGRLKRSDLGVVVVFKSTV